MRLAANTGLAVWVILLVGLAFIVAVQVLTP